MRCGDGVTLLLFLFRPSVYKGTSLKNYAQNCPLDHELMWASHVLLSTIRGVQGGADSCVQIGTSPFSVGVELSAVPILAWSGVGCLGFCMCRVLSQFIVQGGGVAQPPPHAPPPPFLGSVTQPLPHAPPPPVLGSVAQPRSKSANSQKPNDSAEQIGKNQKPEKKKIGDVGRIRPPIWGGGVSQVRRIG